jgi:hypothetical protein
LNFLFILIPSNLIYEYLHPIYIFLDLEGIFRLTIMVISKVFAKYIGRRRAAHEPDKSMFSDQRDWRTGESRGAVGEWKKEWGLVFIIFQIQIYTDLHRLDVVRIT